MKDSIYSLFTLYIGTVNSAKGLTSSAEVTNKNPSHQGGKIVCQSLDSTAMSLEMQQWQPRGWATDTSGDKHSGRPAVSDVDSRKPRG